VIALTQIFILILLHRSDQSNYPGGYWARFLSCIALVKKTIEVIEQLKPKYFVIENPRGMLRKQDFIQSFHRDTVTYCQYGAKTQKPTDLWNNLKLNFKPMCKPGSPCHEPASRGSKSGVQGINNSFSNLGSKGSVLRAVVPRELVLEVVTHCEKEAPSI